MPRKKNPHLALFTTTSFPGSWENLVLPWFRQAAHASWKNEEQSAVIVPTRSYALFLRRLLLHQDISLFGVRFLTPLALRELIAPDVTIAPRENLRLLLAIAAEAQLDHANSSSKKSFDEILATTARSIARAPDALLNAFEKVGAAGWPFGQIGSRSLARIFDRFQILRECCRMLFPHEIDQAACANKSRKDPLFHELLLAGFDGAHWPLWFLLQAAVRLAGNATVLLHDPREEARTLDETWIGTWEETFGKNAEPVQNDAAPNETLFPELFESNRVARPIHFLVGRTVTEQSEAVVALAQTFLANANCRHLGVLFPATGALPRTVASLLAELEIPFYDGIAHLAPGPLEDDAWTAWLALQENPRLRLLLRFLDSLPVTTRPFGQLPIDRIENVLRQAYRDLLMDDLELLREFCATHSRREGSDEVAAGLQKIRFLSDQATFSEFLAQTREILEAFSWHDRWSYLDAASATWRDRFTEKFSRATFLRWLAEVSTSLLPERSRQGDHPYSRVELLLCAHAEGQQWSHLIFTGLNEGLWPPRFEESGFIDEADAEALNARIGNLNRHALQQGSQGEGHSIVADGKIFCLGAREYRHLAQRQFRNLLDSTVEGIGVSANLVEESAPERLANPSEFFTQLYFETRGEALSQSVMSALQKQTEAWVKSASVAPNEQISADISQTAVAYHARRSDQPFGEHEFALRVPVAGEVTISATDWENALKVNGAPALVWMKRFLGVQADEDEFVVWAQASGQWVHHWLRHIAPADAADQFAPWPSADKIRERISAAALRFRDEVSRILSHFGRPLPEWWLSGWRQASYMADRLADRVSGVEGWSQFMTEWTLPRRSLPLVADDASSAVSISGRIDLVLGRGLKSQDAVLYRDLWVVDYKTGNRKNLTSKKLLQGSGVQLALYALVLRALGATEVAASILTRQLELDQPQLGLSEIAAHENFWRALARMAQTGVFGMRGELRSEFGFQNDYPLAAIAIDPDLLEEKWARTYPDLASSEAEE